MTTYQPSPIKSVRCSTTRSLACGQFTYARLIRFLVTCPAIALLAMLPVFVFAQNPIVVENARTGNPSSQWDISGAGDPSIQGFATDISVARGGIVRFKVSTTASNYRLDIYRLGYYAGNGARFIATVQPSATLPQNQPNPIVDSATGLIDCGNWAESASWNVPADAVSGLYIAKLVRADNGGASHIPFVVRDDASTSDLLFQTSDTTWQAYNSYGGNSLYVGNPAGRAYKVSYNRPFNTRAGATSSDWLFSVEYPMIRWLEANGYDVTYTTGVDTDRRGNLLLQHKAFLSVGHDEYWSGSQRANVEAARNQGVHLAFFSGNAVFWKTRWESSIDGANTPYRTLVCYKETHANAKIDPSAAWTGTWRDPRFSPPADGGRPENALMGTIFAVNSPRNDPISIPAAYGPHRFWRNTGVATQPSGGSVTLPAGVLGYEWDEAPLNAAAPPALMFLSETTLTVNSRLLDYGSTYGSGPATHQLTLYRHSSGALVFGAGTVQWPWGLDSQHDNPGTAVSQIMRQATMNLFADMRVQPATPQSGLVPTSPSTDLTAPVATMQTPASGASLPVGVAVTISGIASDAGGQVWGVEVSTDNGVTWRRAIGRQTWSLSWTPTATGTAVVRVRAFDDSGNLSAPSAGNTVTITAAPAAPISIWASTTVPAIVDGGADSPVQLGVKFRSDVAGLIRGIRFYKASTNTGTHVGSLWSSTGTRLANATFTNETASGWQQVLFATPVSITANTVYIASYHATVGHYSTSVNYFATSGFDNPPLHALASGVSGANGVYAYGSAATFPSQTWNNTNYWVDVVFEPAVAPTLNAVAVTPANPSLTVGATQQFTATGTYSNGSSQNLTTQVTWASSSPARATINSSGLATGLAVGTTTISATLGSVSGNTLLTVQSPPVAITTSALPGGTAGTPYSATLTATGGTLPYTWAVTAGALPPGLTLNATTGTISGTPSTASTSSFTVRVTDAGIPAQTITRDLSITVDPVSLSIWASTAVPASVDSGPDSAVQLGVKFRSDVAGLIRGIRFYKASTNTGTHVGNLWSSTGTRLANATFTNETASGWQQVLFATPVAINANTVYIASYHAPVGHYSASANYFASGFDNPPLHALASGVSGANGVFAYGSAATFPTQSWNNTNYWVDVVFSASPSIDIVPPQVAAVSPANESSAVALGSAVAASFNESVDPATINSNTVTLRTLAGALVPAAVTYNSLTRTLALVPTGPLAPATTYTVTLLGGSGGIKDLAGNPLALNFTSTFSTITYGAAAGGPGGPVLVVTNASNPFTRYYAEVLLAEGINCFALADVSTLAAGTLDAYDVVILGETALSAAQVTLLTAWVNAGGNLIAMRPDKQLAPLLGLTDAAATLREGYLLVNTAEAPGAGIVAETIQYHGTADLYTLAGATGIATLYTNATTGTPNPAVTLRSVGANGGQAAAFTFDLARSIIQTRQGNPAWINQDRDGRPPVRSDDLFYGAASFDPQPDWVNLEKAAIPQADEQQHLLANLIIRMNADRKPIPRFWFLPHGHKAAVVMTGDDHSHGGTKSHFDAHIAYSPPSGSVDDWQMVRSTSYIYPTSTGTMTNAEAEFYTLAGFELALHLTSNAIAYTPAMLDGFFTTQLAQFRALFPTIPSPVTNRIHAIVWSGYTILPEVGLNHGIRMDTSYYFWPEAWVGDRPGLFTGSGLPMRFAKVDGTVIDVYQATTQMTDESAQTYPYTVDTLLDRALGPEGYYGAFVTNMHTDFFPHLDSDKIVLSAVSRGVPIISARQLLTWTDARNSSAIKSLARSGNTITFTIDANRRARGLRTMLPVAPGQGVGSVTFNGSALPYSIETMKGISYAVFSASAGSYSIVLVP